MKKPCTICGCSYGEVYAFKGGSVCEDCLQLLKTSVPADGPVRLDNHKE
jgi:hypothetical protein